DVVREVLELFELESTDQPALKLGEQSVPDAFRIEAVEVLLAVQHVDVFAAESGTEQRIDDGPGLGGVADSPNHAVRRVTDEIPSISAHWFIASLAMIPVNSCEPSTAPWAS